MTADRTRPDHLEGNPPAESGAPRCRACGGGTDAFLCWSCAGQLEKTIAELPAAIADLEITVTRQSKVGNGSRPAETAPEVEQADTEQRKLPARLRSREGRITLPTTVMPLSLGAAHLHALAVNAVQTWVRHLAESRGLTIQTALRPIEGPIHEECGHPSCADIRDRRAWALQSGMFGLCAWLVHHIDAIRLDEAAGDMHRGLTALRQQIDQAVDRRDPDVFAGRCTGQQVRVRDVDGVLVPEVGTCGAEVMAHDGDVTATCPSCGAEYDLAKRTQRMREQAADQWARPHAIANALTTLDEPVKPETLRKWIQRDREAVERWRSEGGREPDWPLILQVGIDDDGRALFRVGDVQARIAWVRDRASDRRSA